MCIGNRKKTVYNSSLKRCIFFTAFLCALFIFSSQAGANGAKDKLNYAQKRYEELQKSEKRKSYKSLWLDVIKQFESVVRGYPNSDEAAKALFTEGVIYREMFNYSITLGELYKSEKAFKRFLRKYPKHPLCEDARKNISEIKVQKYKNNLVRVSSTMPVPEKSPGKDKAPAVAKPEEKPKKTKKRYFAKVKTAPPEEDRKREEVVKKKTPPPKAEEPKKIETVKYEAALPSGEPKKDETPSREVSLAKAKIPAKTKGEDAPGDETLSISNGTGGGEAAPQPKTETVRRVSYNPDKSTVELSPPPRIIPYVAEVMTIRYFSDTDHTRIVVDTNSGITYKGASLPENVDVGVGPRIYIDLFDTRLSPGLDSPIDIGDGLVDRIRWSQNREKVVRVVLDLEDVAGYTVFSLKNPDRVVIDVLRD